MNCRRVREIVFLYTDNEMGQELLISFREHLALCPPCTRRMEAADRLLNLIREHCSRESAPERLRRRILTSFPHRQA